jgi:hypothetical protein
MTCPSCGSREIYLDDGVPVCEDCGWCDESVLADDADGDYVASRRYGYLEDDGEGYLREDGY